MNNDIDVGGNGSVSSATHLQIYVYGDQTVKVHGNPAIKAFVFAPESEGVYAGNQAFAGAFWVKTYEDNGSAGTFEQTLTEDDLEDLEIAIPEPTEAFAMTSIDSFTTTEATDVTLAVPTPVVP